MAKIFNSLADTVINGRKPFVSKTITRDMENIAGFDFVSFPNPTHLLVSRWYPGYRLTDLTGATADEALALTLGAAMATIGDLQGFQRILSTPGIAIDVMTRLFPRAHVALRSRVYSVTDSIVASIVGKVIAERAPTAGRAVTMAYVHVITRILNSKELVSMSGIEQRVVGKADTYTLTSDALRLTIMTEAMRGIFSESRIQSVVKSLDVEATPVVFGERMGDMFRQFARAIPEIQLRLKQFDSVTKVVHAMNVQPDSVPEELRSHPSLLEISNFANFVVYAQEAPYSLSLMPADAIEELRRAADAVLTVIQSAPSIESIPLSKYADMFGEVPVASPNGNRRGLVLYTTGGQTSRLEVADVVVRDDGLLMTQTDPMYTQASSIAGPLTGSLLSGLAIHGLANIVADEVSQSPEIDE